MPSTRSPVIATRSASSPLTASTIASRYGRLMVGPTWMSLICAIVKPSSAGGSPAIGTSTRTTDAVRRALKKPQAVTSNAVTATARALPTAAAGRPARMRRRPADAAPARPGRDRARQVSTNSDENRPIASEPGPGQPAVERTFGIGTLPAQAERHGQERRDEPADEQAAGPWRTEVGSDAPADVQMEQEGDRAKGHRRQMGSVRQASMACGVALDDRAARESISIGASFARRRCRRTAGGHCCPCARSHPPLGSPRPSQR